MTAHYVYETTPYKHQIDGVHKCYPLPFYALFMEQGTGKTKTEIDINVNKFLEKKIDAVLLIAPSGVQEQWAYKELPKHHAKSVPYLAYVWDGVHTKKRKDDVWKLVYEKSDKLKWFCVNVEAFSSTTALGVFREFLKNNKVHVCIDEATVIKTPDAERSINIIQGLSVLERAGRVITKVSPMSVSRSILTGTMVTNSPYDIWNMFEFLSPGFFKMDHFTFRLRYGIERKMQIPGTNRSYWRRMKRSEIESIHKYASMGKTMEDISVLMHITESSVRFLLDNPHIKAPYKNLEQLKALIEPYSYIVRKADCLDLPPKIYEELPVAMSDEQRRIYHDMKTKLCALYDGGALSAINKIVLIQRLQQITGGFFPYREINEDGSFAAKQDIKPIGATNPKIKALIANLEECATRPVIIAARFRAEINAIHEALSKTFDDERVEKLYGDTNTEIRRELRDAFENNEIDLFVVSPTLVKRGFNMQNCSMMYIYSNDYSLETREQLEDRIHRDGQKSDTIVYKDIVVKGSVDEQVLAVLRDKRDLLEYMRDKSLTAFLGSE